jgi:hypothetical protein
MNALACTLAFAVSAAPAADDNAAHQFLRKTIGFTAAQIAAVDAGQVVTKPLPSADSRRSPRSAP